MHVSAFLFIDLFYLVLDEFGKACGTSYDRIPKDTKYTLTIPEKKYPLNAMNIHLDHQNQMSLELEIKFV